MFTAHANGPVLNVDFMPHSHPAVSPSRYYSLLKVETWLKSSHPLNLPLAYRGGLALTTLVSRNKLDIGF